MISDLVYRFRALLHRQVLDDELEEELRYHLDREAERVRAQGLSEQQARREAALAFGGIESVKEDCRQARGTAFIESIWSDLRYGLRLMRKWPGSTAAAALSLAIGLGSNTAVFSLLDRAVFRSLPVERSQDLVVLRLEQDHKTSSFSYPFFKALEREQRGLEGVFASADYPLRGMMVHGQNGVTTGLGRMVSGSYFKVLRVRPGEGRLLSIADDRPGSPGVAVISDRFWQRQFGRSPRALGEILRINQAQLTIVGVTPPGFSGEKPGSVPDIWIPMAQQPMVAPQDLLGARFATWLNVLGRMPTGGSREAAAQALSSLARANADLTVRTIGGSQLGIRLEDGSQGLRDLTLPFHRPLWLLMAMATLVLLAACFNVANLLLARGSARGHELAIRLAIGGGRWRLVRQLMVENALIVLVGAALGVALALWMGQGLIRLAPPMEQVEFLVDLDWRMLLYMSLIAVVAAVLSGAFPALAATKPSSGWSLTREARTVTPGRALSGKMQVLMAIQVAMSVVVVCAAAVLVNSLLQLRNQDFGFRQRGLVMVKIPLEISPQMMKRHESIRSGLLERVSHLPGVRLAALSCCGPFDDIARTAQISGEGVSTQSSRPAHIVHVSDGYFETMGMGLVSGRALNGDDRAGSDAVAVISETAAVELFGEKRAVGKRISLGQFDSTKAMRVVGVSKDVRFAGPGEAFGPLVFVPMAQKPAPVTSVSVRSSEPASLLTPALRRAVQETVPGVNVGSVELYETIVEERLHKERLLSVLALVFGGQVLVLCGFGVYGLTAFTAVCRRREMGIRIALGASSGQVTRVSLSRTARVLAVGAAGGLIATVPMREAMRGLVFASGTGNGIALAAGILVTLCAGLLAALWPALAAARNDPLETLRAE